MKIHLFTGLMHGLFLSLIIFFPHIAFSQDRCGTMTVLEAQFQKDPSLRQTLINKRESMLKAVDQRRLKGARTTAEVTIPVVFHIVLRNPSAVSDDQIKRQLDTLNKDYAGTFRNDPRIISAFQAVYGQSNIRFALAQRTPDDEPSTGIYRYVTTQNSFTYIENQAVDPLKHVSSGGADAWDHSRYLNVWITNLTNGTLGYATFPGMASSGEDGVVINYVSLPGGSGTGFNYGKTLTHEVGHYFGLYHIWGDDNGSCSGSDYIADTPNQAKETSTLYTGIKYDNCSPTGSGIMYQNYMDYTPDAGLLMFTAEQVEHMEAVLSTDRLSLTTSNGATPISLYALNAQLVKVSSPDQRICSGQFIPKVILKNQGSEVLRSLTVKAQLDNGEIVTQQWSGSLATYAETEITLSSMTATTGNHILNIWCATPNGGTDQDTSNDEASLDFMYYEPVSPPVVESFEGDFLPKGWDIVNVDGGSTWVRDANVSKTGRYSVKMANYDYNAIGQKDYLRSPTVNIANADSAFVSFKVAASNSISARSQNTVWDTLQVLVSTDCGKTYTSVYKKWGTDLGSRTSRTSFTPGTDDWKSEEINIGQFINQGNVLVAFMNSNGNNNNLYLDDIKIRTVVVNPNLKEAGFLVTPNPTNGAISVQFYPAPTGLLRIEIYNISGQLIEKQNFEGIAKPGYQFGFDLTYAAGGMYIVKAVFADKVLTKRFVKLK